MDLQGINNEIRDLTKMKIVITGGMGFVGTNLCEYLRKKFGNNVKIYVIDNLKNDCGYNTFYDVLLSCDISDLINLGNMDYLVHLAAETDVRKSMINPEYVLYENINNTLKCLEMCKKSKIKKMVFASSCGVVGDQDGIVFEDTIPNPISPYSASKIMGEDLCQIYSKLGVNVDSLRFSNIYGKYSNHKGSVIAKFIKQCIIGEPIEIYGKGDQTRDFIHIDDICEAIVRSLQLESSSIYNICTSENTSINELVKLLKKSFPDLELSYQPAVTGDIKELLLSNNKMKRELDMYPEKKLEESLPEIVEWFKDDTNLPGIT